MHKHGQSGRISNFVIALLVFNVLMIAIIVGLLVGGGIISLGSGSGERVATAVPQAQTPPTPVVTNEPTPMKPEPAADTPAAAPAADASAEKQSIAAAAESLITPPPPPPTDNPDTPAAEPDVTATGAVAMLPDGTSPLVDMQPGMTYSAVAQLLGVQGEADDDAENLAFHPVGWYRYRWSDENGGVVIALFSDQGILMNVESSGVAGVEALLAQPGFKIPAWLNESFREAGMPVRAVGAALGQPVNGIPYQAQLANEAGQMVGTATGNLYVGDGATTYIPGDPQPFTYAIEGEYQYFFPNGSQDANSYAFVQH